MEAPCTQSIQLHFEMNLSRCLQPTCLLTRAIQNLRDLVEQGQQACLRRVLKLHLCTHSTLLDRVLIRLAKAVFSRQTGGVPFCRRACRSRSQASPNLSRSGAKGAALLESHCHLSCKTVRTCSYYCEKFQT